MPKGLTNKQQIFVAEYLKGLTSGGSAKDAAIKAGYSAKSAESQSSQLLKIPKVSEAISRKTEKRLEKIEVSTDYVLTGIKDTIERCRQATPVLDRKGNHVYVETDDGQVLPSYTFQALGALKGYELLGKHLKLFTEKQEIDARLRVVVDVVRPERGNKD